MPSELRGLLSVEGWLLHERWMMRKVRNLLKKALFIGAFCALFAVWIASEKSRVKRVRPPAGATNLVKFLQARPEALKIRKFTNEDKTYIEVLGYPTRPGLSLPSGPPSYVFNESGILVDWASDRGEASAFVKKWGSLSEGIFISVEEARRMMTLTP